MPHLILLAMLAFAFSPSPVSAQMEAQEVLWYCTDPLDPTDHERVMRYFKCLGYIQGAHDMMSYLFTFGGRKTDLYCLPKKGISVDQLRRILIKWIEQNPEMMNATVRQAIQIAIMEAFPCHPQRQSAQRQTDALPPPPRN